eukprot:symbB.v1.2.033273.t1/scaffold4105.1/size64512/5
MQVWFALLPLGAADPWKTSHVASGYPVQQLDRSTLEGGDLQLNGLQRLSDRPTFSNLQSLRQSCSSFTLGGRAGLDFADDKKAEQLQDEVTRAVQDRKVLDGIILACPPLALKLLLLFVEKTLRAPMDADLAEANEVHVTFNTLKVWLFHDVLPHENPEEVIAGWNLEATEAKLFNHYKNLWRAIYTRDAQRDSQENSPDFIAMALDQNQRGHEKKHSKSFYDLCPEAEKSQHVNEGQWGKVVEGPVPSKMLLIGNSLSLYWQARGLADLLGASFLATGGQGSAERFPDFLPRARQGVAWSSLFQWIEWET